MKCEFKNEFTGHRAVLADFIQMYRNEPSLWMTKAPEYRDRVSKDQAYEKLAIKLREIDPLADRDRVVKKINSLRTNWRKEKKKIDEADSKHPYKPRLWYYEMFEFLDDEAGTHLFTDIIKDNDSDRAETTEEEDESFPDPLDYEDLHNEEPEDEYKVRLPKSVVKTSPINSGYATSHQSAAKVNKPAPKALKRLLSDDYNDIEVYDGFSQTTKKKAKGPEDRHDIFGRNVAMKLRSIQDHVQRLLAEKLINDALFTAEMGELNMSHAVTSFNVESRSGYETEYLSEPIEQYETISQDEMEQSVHVQTKQSAPRSMAELQEISRSILKRF